MNIRSVPYVPCLCPRYKKSIRRYVALASARPGCGTGGRVLVIRPSDVYAGVFSAKLSTHNAVLAGSLPVVSVQRCGTSPRRLLTAGSRDRNNHDVLMVHRHSLCVVTLALYFTAGFLNSPKNAFSSAVFRITRYLVKCLRSVTWHFGHYNRLFLLTYLLTYLLTPQQQMFQQHRWLAWAHYIVIDCRHWQILHHGPSQPHSAWAVTSQLIQDKPL